jgi:hypothetical protein
MTIVLALVAGLTSASLILVDRYQDPLSVGPPSRIAGLATVAAGVLLQWGQRGGAGWNRFTARLAERLVDAVLLGSVAWVAADPPSGPSILSSPDPWLSAVALTALGTAYLAAYVRAKALGLGFQVPELPGLRLIHFGLLGAGLLLWNSAVEGALPVALWLAAALSAVDVGRGSLLVARQREAP